MQQMQEVKASAPWKIQKKTFDARHLVVTREQFLKARMSCVRQPVSDSAGLHSMSRQQVAAALSTSAKAATASYQLPPGLDTPPGLVHPSERTSESVKESRLEPSKKADSVEASTPSCEYKVLLQNLPKSLMKETVLREMIRQAELRDVKKLAFRSDGRVLITVTTHAALCQCVTHFNGLPWFDAPACTVPVLTATQVVSKAKPVAAVTSSLSTLSSEAPVFVPSAVQWTATAEPQSSKASGKAHETDSLSEKSTDGEFSEDESMSCSDLEPEAQLVLA
jgi:hypothetical protein